MLQDESFFNCLDKMGLALSKPGKTGAPVMVCAGSDDALFTVREAEKTAEAYGVTAQIFEGSPATSWCTPIGKMPPALSLAGSRELPSSRRAAKKDP